MTDRDAERSAGSGNGNPPASERAGGGVIGSGGAGVEADRDDVTGAQAAPQLAELAVAAPGPEDDSRQVATQIEDIAPDEGAAVLEDMASEDAADVAEYLDPETAGAILSEMDPALAASVLNDMEPPEASMVVSAMDPDDAVDVLEHVPRVRHDAILDEMEASEAAGVRALEQHRPDTAGGIMTSEVTALREDLTVAQAIDELRRINEELEQMFYVYVVDARGHLVGVLSMRDLILARPDRLLSKVMRPEVLSVPATMDQEEVALLMRRQGYLAVPVVDAKDRLVGLVTFDDAADVLEEEATEDVQKMFGAGGEERLSSPWRFSFKRRVWWLLVNLGTAFLAASVVKGFDKTITQLAILAAFMPVVAGMGGNASAQAMAVTVRGIAMGRVDRKLLRHVLRREMIVGLLTGVVVGLTAAGVALLWYGNPGNRAPSIVLGVVVCLALMINHTLACVSGAAIPFIMKRLGFDPAQSATIFATTVTDVVGFFALLGLACLSMKWLLPGGGA